MNTKFEINQDNIVIYINKNIYPKEVLIQTSYVKLDKYYFFIDENQTHYIMFVKEKEEITQDKEKIVYEIFDELIESQSYLNQLERTNKTRELILEKALLGQTLDDETIDALRKNNDE